MNKGVPLGYQHNWRYLGRWRETKVSPGNWRFKFDATKNTRAGSAQAGPGVGTRVLWEIRAIQSAVKRGIGWYQTSMTGTKKLLKFRGV